MTYLDKYPNCNGCPVEKYCGTAVACTKLCHSYNDATMSNEKSHALTLPKSVDMTDEQIEERVTMWDNIKD